MTDGERRRTSGGTWGLVAGLAVLLGLMALTASDRARWELFVASGVLATGVVGWIWHRRDVSAGQVLVFAVLFRLVFAWLPPSLSDDAYRYVWDGWLQAEGVNPYQFRPEADALEALQASELFEELNSEGFYSVYPPVSQLVFAAGGRVLDSDRAGDGWLSSYYVIKLLFSLLELAGVFVLWRLVEARALMLYAWQPLVLVEVAGQGHTEGAMVLFVLLSVWLARRGHGGLAAAALTIAGWVKLYPLVLLVFLWRRFGWRVVAAAFGVSMLAWAPYASAEAPGHIADSLRLYVRYFEYNAGLYYAAKSVLALATGADWSKILGPFMGWVFFAILPLLYVQDRRRGWPVEKAFLYTMSAFLVCATTVHPWYLLAVLPLAVLTAPPAWHWMWLSGASLGTYLHYVDGPYWPWVIVGWSGWAVVALYLHRKAWLPPADRVLQRLQRRRAAGKAERVLELLGGVSGSVLDLGAGEGYVGDAIARRTHARVVLADVVDFNRTDLPLVRYDGRRLPFADDVFDAALLYFVLHHCADQEAVFREALRVTRGPVFVAESTFSGRWGLWLLNRLDRLANRLRSGEAMRAQEAFLHFRTVADWRSWFEANGARVVREAHAGRWIHRQVFFVLERK